MYTNNKELSQGFQVGSQTPIDDRIVVATPADLQDLGTNNVFAYKYYEGLKVLVLSTLKEYIWKESATGLLTTSFTYPVNIISAGINYSNKSFNWVEFTTTNIIPATSGTYTEIAALIASSSLVPGEAYVITDYETEHQITGTTTLNVSSTGYVTKVEQLQLIAKSTTEFFHEAKSLNHPKDNILYDFTLNTVLSQDRKGLIYWRKDNDNDIEAWYDTRNHVVARYSLDTSSIAWSSGTLARGQMVFHSGLVKMSIRANADVTNWRLVNYMTDITSGLHTNNTVTLFSTSIPHDAPTITYHQSITTTATNSIKLGYGVDDVLIDTCTNVVLEEGVTAFSVANSNDIKIGADSSEGIISISNGVELGREASECYIFNSSNINAKSNASRFFLKQATGLSVGYSVSNVFIAQSIETHIGDGCNSIMIIRASDTNTVNNNCGGISLGNSINNLFDQSCSDIEIYSGGYNRFGQGCNAINMLGEKDTAYLAGGPTYYSPYSQMAYNTFGSGCSIITFDILGGRGNTFGDECKNLVFTSAGQNWRLVGCHFVRGVQNKTFQCMVHGSSFLVPNQITATVTAATWYSQVLMLISSGNAENLAASAALNNIASQKLMFGVKSTTMPFFDPASADNVENNGTDLTEAEVSLGGTVGAPTPQLITNRAWMWTSDGFPMSMSLVPNLGSNDATSLLNNPSVGGGTPPS